MKTSPPGKVRGVKSPFILPKSHLLSPKLLKGFPGGSAHPSAKQERRVPSLGEKDPMGGNGNPLQYYSLEKSHGQRNLVGYSPRGRKESDTI